MPKFPPAAKTPVASPTLLMLSFTATPPAAHRVTRVAWTPQAHTMVASLNKALRQQNKQLPSRDLRLRTQVYDAGALRVSYKLGIGYEDSEGDELDILFTHTPPEEACDIANRAVADWVEEAVKKVNGLGAINERVAHKLRQLALNEGAVTARADQVAVFQWDTNPDTGSAWPRKDSPTASRVATGFSDLADYVASLLVGQTVFSEAGPLRREIGSDLQGASARLLTDPVPVQMGTKNRCWLSLGLTVTVATYPGRSLPVIRIDMQKRVWTSVPKASYYGRDLTGFALPKGELRAFQFEIDSHKLTVGSEYRAIARQYTSLPVREDLTATELARDGRSYPECAILVGSVPGRTEVKTAGRGITDLDRQQAIEQIVALLEPHNFAPWGGQLKRVKTPNKNLTGLAAHWQAALQADDKPVPNLAATEDGAKAAKKAATKAATKTANYVQWVAEMHESLSEHYGGQHRLLLAYQDGLLPDAQLVEETLHKVLGTEAIHVQMEMLPEGVHGSKWPSNGEKPRPPAQRAEQRLASWEPWLAEIKQRYQAAERPLPHGVIVIARKKYPGGIDDPISKQVGRVALIQGLQGAVVQYLLPITSKTGVAPTEKETEQFQLRLLNAWRDLTLKSVGGTHNLAERLKAGMPAVQASGHLPVLLGAGIIRVNKSRSKGNTTSFIPYVIELDSANGQCQATMLLKKLGPANPTRRVLMQPLRAAVRELATHGPSYLAEKGTAAQVLRERQQLTEEFLYDTLLERSAQYANREIIVLADMSTLNSIWTWLADASVNPADMRLHRRTKFQEALPNVTLVRIRPGHAPKALLPTPNVNVAFVQPDGTLSTPRLSATWCDAKLYRLTDTSSVMPTYFSYGSRLFKPVRSLSSYRPTVSVKAEGTKHNEPFTKSWATPNAVEITVLQDPKRAPRFAPDELATLVETLRGTYNHFGGWTTMPGPLHFASFLKEYVPDYELAEAEADARQEAAED
jgi:hypothetical protein